MLECKKIAVELDLQFANCAIPRQAYLKMRDALHFLIYRHGGRP